MANKDSDSVGYMLTISSYSHRELKLTALMNKMTVKQLLMKGAELMGADVDESDLIDGRKSTK